ncbi:MAG: SpoIIE family protein phosphatase [Firmicutes bacterium]|nr:SpoIIE family protein phosphatase [Bacillota bacterium]
MTADKKQKVLIVDDTPENIDLINGILENHYSIKAALNGKKALKIAQSQDPPDIILLDIMMPDMDGYEVCGQLKSNPATASIPVIFITALSEIEDERKGLDMGAVDYITKPVSPPVVLSRVRNHLELKRYRDDLEAMVKEKTAELLEAVAARERIESELKIARDIQLSILPRTFPAFPDRTDFDIHALIVPARDVGGDFYDFFLTGENHLFFCIGDVSGKGVPAALLMTLLKKLVKVKAMEVDNPAEVLEFVNRHFYADNEACMFATIFCGMLDLKTGIMTYSNAGHEPPLIISPEWSVRETRGANGGAVGFEHETQYENGTIEIRNGEIIGLYTDGITEAFNSNNRMYSRERVEAWINSHKPHSAKDLVESLYNEIKTFSEGSTRGDDITVLAVKYHPGQ